MDEIPTPVVEESLQACIQVLFDELHLLFPVAVPMTHLYRYLVSDVS
jgi:phosphotransferase system  glucose/maltose/N-acetylglucosamine-specific IIC component